MQTPGRSASFLVEPKADAAAGVYPVRIETPEGKLIDGPSLTVDHLLDVTGADSVAQLDRAIGGQRRIMGVWELGPLFDGDLCRRSVTAGLDSRLFSGKARDLEIGAE